MVCRGYLFFGVSNRTISHRADTVEVPQGGFWLNLTLCHACSSTKHRRVKITKENCRSFEKASKSWESVGIGSQGRPELVLFTPAALSYFSVKDWLSCFSVTWCYPLYSHPEVSKIQYFQQFSSTYVWSGHNGAEGSRYWALKVTRDRETLLQRFFSSAWLIELSKSITVYNKIINVYFVPCIYFFSAIHFLLTSVNTLTMVTAVLVSVPAAIKNTECPGQQSITGHSHTHTEGQFRLQSTSRAYECHRVISCSVIWSAVSHNYRNPLANTEHLCVFYMKMLKSKSKCKRVNKMNEEAVCCVH